MDIIFQVGCPRKSSLRLGCLFELIFCSKKKPVKKKKVKMSYGENELGQSRGRKEAGRLKHNEKQNKVRLEI